MYKKQTVIRETGNRKVVYGGNFRSEGECLEKAISEGIKTTNLDLRHADLSGSNLDASDFSGSWFHYSNLTGANMSECRLESCIFYNAQLYNCCLCDAEIISCDMRFAEFGATDISGSYIQNTVFAGLSSFTLNFINARMIQNCFYQSACETISNITSPPIVISGLRQTITFLDDTILQGNEILRSTEKIGEKAVLHDKNCAYFEA